jgi:hemerythrin-like domain-containing protein
MPATRTKERQAEARTRRAATSRTAKSGSAKYPGVLAMLKEEHDMVKDLFDQFEKETETKPEAGKATADKICMELTRHAEMEEQIVYPALQKQDEDIYHEAEEEHHVAEFLIKEIQAMKPDGAWRAKVTVLAENVRHHIDEEETEAFKELKKLDSSELDRMAEQWEKAKAAWKPSKVARVA